MFFLPKKTDDSILLNQDNFYNSFAKDVESSRNEVIIESPFITSTRMAFFYPIFQRLLFRNVRIYIITRDPVEHEEEFMRHQATNEILRSVELGIKVILLSGYHHRKLAIIDKHILWEGSLNIFSFNRSQEIMRRIDDVKQAKQMISFLDLKKYL